MSVSGNVWAVMDIQQVCNIFYHTPLFQGFSCSQNVNKEIGISQFSMPYGISKKVYYTSEFWFWGVFLCKLWYYYNIKKRLFDWSDLNERLCGSN